MRLNWRTITPDFSRMQWQQNRRQRQQRYSYDLPFSRVRARRELGRVDRDLCAPRPLKIALAILCVEKFVAMSGISAFGETGHWADIAE